MSGNITAKQVNKAAQKIFADVYLPTFLSKLASDYGIECSSEEDVQNLVNIAANLAQLDSQRQQQTVKTASDKSPLSEFLKYASNSLSTSLNGVSQDELQVEELKARQIVAAIKQDKELLDAAKIYGYAVAQG